MVDLKILEAFGSTRDRFREVLTSSGEQVAPVKGESKEEKSARIEKNRQRKRDFEFRQKFQNMIQSRIISGIEYSLKNCRPYRAVDLAWDSTVLAKINMPLLLYAQGKIDVQYAANQLSKLKNGEDYIVRQGCGGTGTCAAGKCNCADKDKPVGINVPKFIEGEVNLIRSMINRRHAAQKNKYSNLWPHYNYESRSTGLVGKCRADILSQNVDMQVDQYGVRHHDSQVMLDGLLYGHSIDFVRCSWEVEKQLRLTKPDADPKDKANHETYISKQGLGWINPHPSRIFWDLSHPLPTLNSDSGCEYVGFWDVVKFSSIDNNPFYFNKESIGFGDFWGSAGLFNQYTDYFNQYNYVINKPQGSSVDVAGMNDAKAQTSFYSQTTRDSALFKTEYFHKLVPKEWGVGEYPHEVWARIVVASDSVPIFAEFLPSRPGAVLSINENDSRAVSISMAMDVMQFQTQMTNLLTHFMKLLQIEAFKAIGINTDALEPDEVDKIDKMLKADDWYSDPLVYRYSLSKKLEQLGINPSKAMTDVITVSEAKQSQSINTVFDSMTKLLQLAERMNAMSAAESGQSEPREISATQTNVISNTTQTVYSAISDCIDDWREAKKQIYYESTVVCQEGDVRCPVKNRYTKKTIIAAGFKPDDNENEDWSGEAKRATVYGSPKKLIHSYIFSSRDGSERAVNTQAANTLVQTLSFAFSSPVVVQALGKEKVFMIINEIFRMSGSGIDVNLELAEGEDDSLGENEIEALKGSIDEIAGMFQQLAKQTQKNAQDIAGQTQVNEEQQQHIELNAQLAEKLLNLQNTVQEMQMKNNIEAPEIKYADAPPSVQAQIEAQHGFKPAPASERIAKTKSATRAKV